MLGGTEYVLESVGLQLVVSIPTVHSTVLVGGSADQQPYLRLPPHGFLDDLG